MTITIRITPNPLLTVAGVGQVWTWWAFKDSALAGKTPTFLINKSNYGDAATVADYMRYGCWGTAIDSDVWNDFGAPVIGATDISFAPASALPSGVLYFAMYPLYPMSRTTRKVSEWMAHDYVSDTTSSTDGVIGTSTERANGQNSRTAPALPFHGFKISKASANTKNKAIFTSGNHANEPMGRFALEGAIDWLLGGSANAEALLDWFDFYVYPCVSPQGVWGGHHRACAQTPAVNHNRQWNTTGTVECVDAFKVAFAADTSSAVDAAIDFHGSGSPGNGAYSYGYVEDKSAAYYAEFETEMKALDGANFTLIDTGPITESLTRLCIATYGALLSVTVEAASSLVSNPTTWKSFGAHGAETLYSMLLDGFFTNHPA